MGIPRLEDLESLDGARVLLRLDLNVPLHEGSVEEATRIDAALPTIEWLLDRAGVVAACSHLGKPKGRPRPELSLRPVATVLAQRLARPVRFVPECVGGEVTAALAETPAGSLLVLENLRFDPGEEGNDPEFARALAEPFSHYVNDAFGTAHRAHASVAAVAGLFSAGRKATGRLMEMELDALSCLMARTERPFVAVVGGAKVSTKTAPLSALVERVDSLAIGGGMANTFLLARGLEVGASLVEPEMVETARAVAERAAARGVELILPEDVVMADAVEAATRVEVVDATKVAPGMCIVDIGPATRERVRATIEAARTVFWNGPMGVFEVEAFAAGTMVVAEAMARCEGFTVVGGGESVMAAGRAGVLDRLGHVSTGGGASLKFIAGDELPAVNALER